MPVVGSKTAFMPLYSQQITRNLHFNLLKLLERLLLVEYYFLMFCGRFVKDNEAFK